MIMHTEDAYVKLFAGADTAENAWRKLHENFEKTSNARVVQLRKKLTRRFDIDAGKEHCGVHGRVPRDQDGSGDGGSNRFRARVGGSCLEWVAKGVCNHNGVSRVERDGVDVGYDSTQAHAKGVEVEELGSGGRSSGGGEREFWKGFCCQAGTFGMGKPLARG
jgi:hypothetical protein